jgi:LysM domain
MHDHLMRKVWFAGWIVIVTLAAGCFQPAGGGLEATNVAQSLPTFTPLPTDTPSPAPQPTEMPTEEVIILPTETPIPFDTFPSVGTQVADASNQGQIDPFSQAATSTAIFLQQSGGLQTFEQPSETIDPLYQQATDMVRQATETAGAPLTQTAIAVFGGITPTVFVQPTWTSVGPVLQGNDCIYEVQPGDRNLYRISLLFGIPYMSIASATHMVNPNLIHLGDRLTIPGCGVTGYQPPPTSTPSATYTYPGITPIPGGGNGQPYTVQQGDTLFALSLRWNTTVYAIAQLNNIPNINLIYIDQVLYIP